MGNCCTQSDLSIIDNTSQDHHTEPPSIVFNPLISIQDDLQKEKEKQRDTQKKEKEKEILPYENNDISQLQMFCYSQIFRNFEIDQQNLFIRKFTSHVTLLNNDIAKFLANDYVNYLTSAHHLEKRKFDFEILKTILTADLQVLNSGNQSTADFDVKNNLTQENFYQQIVKMYLQDGTLYKVLNQTLRTMTLSMHQESVFYLLCLIFAFGNREKKIQEDITVYRGITVSAENYQKAKAKYAKDKIIINYDFISTSKRKNIAETFMNQQNQPYKILFEIHIEKESTDNSFLTLKPYDVTEQSSFANEEEVILPLNGVFQVIKFQEDIGNSTTIQMDFKTNLILDSRNFLLKEPELAHMYGIYQTYRNENTQQILLLKVNPGDFDINTFLNLNMTSLRSLSLNSNQIGDQGMKDFAGHLNSLTCLQQLELRDNAIEDGGMTAFALGLIYLPELQQLDVSLNHIGNKGMKALASQLVYIPNLQKLDVSENVIGEEGFQAFASQLCQIVHLEQLNLCRNQVGDNGVKAFAEQLMHLPNLQQLNLGENKISDVGMIALAPQFSHITKLKEISLIMNQIGNEGIKAFAAQLQMLTKLQLLDFRMNKIGNEGIKAFAAQLVHLVHLQNWNLSMNQIGEPGIKALASQLSHLTSIQYLYLAENKFWDDGVKTISTEVAHLPKLQELDLSMNRTEDETQEVALGILKTVDPSWTCDDFCFKRKAMSISVSKLFCEQMLEDMKLYPGDSIKLSFRELQVSNMQYYSKVHVMDLSQNQIGDEGMKAFAGQLMHLTNLQQLDLSWNKIGNEGIMIFASQLVYLTNLQRLDLRWNQIGDEGIKAFGSQLFHLAGLQQLDLGENQIGDDGIGAFAVQLVQLPNLSKLDIGGNKIREEGVQVLAGQMIHLAKIEMLVINRELSYKTHAEIEDFCKKFKQK